MYIGEMITNASQTTENAGRLNSTQLHLAIRFELLDTRVYCKWIYFVVLYSEYIIGVGQHCRRYMICRFSFRFYLVVWRWSWDIKPVLTCIYFTFSNNVMLFLAITFWMNYICFILGAGYVIYKVVTKLTNFVFKSIWLWCYLNNQNYPFLMV